jgi:hypothetical protein
MTRESMLITALARARGVSEAVIRIEFPGPEDRHVCECCGHVWDSIEAALACATYDDQRD